MICRDEPITCRRKLADRLGLVPHKTKTWQFTGECPNCQHGGFSISAPDQRAVPLRHIWHCNCHRCRCDPSDVREAMERAGIPAACLGAYARKPRAERRPATEADAIRAALVAILADDKIRALADLKLKVAEVAYGQEVPGDWAGFLDFAERANVGRRQRYEAADRWGRRKRQ